MHIAPKHIAIVGAGMAGLACADLLTRAGHTALLHDKGRGPGGRMSTRRLQTPLGDVAFDHGAQYFTARDPAFARLVADWSALGLVAPWPQAGTEAWVGVPGMNAIVRHMAASHDVSWDSPISALVRREAGWWLIGKAGEAGPFDAVIVAVPAEQAAAMLSLHDFSMARLALNARSQPCWTGMMVFDARLDALPSVVRQSGAIAWAARNSEKPDRSGPEAWVVQASPAWSGERLEDSPGRIEAQLLAALAEAAGCAIPQPVAAAVHRWRYALSAGTGDGALWNPAIGLGVCGDWLLGPRIECAWLSGRMLAESCLDSRASPLARAARAVPVNSTPSC